MANRSRTDPAFARSHATLRGARLRNRLLASMLALLVLYTAVVAKTLVVPILLAILLSLMLTPAVRWLCRWYLPRALASILVLVAFIAVLTATVSVLSSPLQSFLTKAPDGLQRIEQAVTEWRRPIDDVSRRAGESLERLAQIGQSSTRTTSVVQETPGLLTRLVSGMPALLASAVVVLFLSFLLLLYGQAILRKGVSLLPRFQDRRRLIESTRRTQQQLSAYVLTISAINLGLGVVVAGVLALIGVDDPWLWGGVVAILNFAPYVGPAVGAILLTLAGFAQFPDPGQALLLPLVFLTIQALEGQLLTPMILGRSMSLDPIVVFLSLLLLGWLWGVVGVLIAVPLLTCVRIIAEQVRGWYPLAQLLGPAPKRVQRPPRSKRRIRRKQAAAAAIPSVPDALVAPGAEDVPALR